MRAAGRVSAIADTSSSADGQPVQRRHSFPSEVATTTVGNSLTPNLRQSMACRSASTMTQTNCRESPTSLRSISALWANSAHQWHQAARKTTSIGLFSAVALRRPASYPSTYSMAFPSSGGAAVRRTERGEGDSTTSSRISNPPQTTSTTSSAASPAIQRPIGLGRGVLFMGKPAGRAFTAAPLRPPPADSKSGRPPLRHGD